MAAKRAIAVLGSTGSIGRQTLDVIGQHPDLFRAELLTANTNASLLIEQALAFDPAAVVIRDETFYREVADTLQPRGIKVFTGMDSIRELASADNIDTVVAAMVGFSGLEPTIAALEHGKTVALANKETLVAAGRNVLRAAVKNGGTIVPVDSEHSAIFQCLHAAPAGSKIEKIHLTASGGPFRTWTRERIAAATPAEALRHPRWNMGSKVTVDSATMMNKGLEIIEAYWLFDAAPDQIDVVVHPESVIHSMVGFSDGAVIAQLACPDMRLPIQYALSYPQRLPLNVDRLDFASLGRLTFEAPDRGRFPALALAEEAFRRGGNIPCAMNAANEVAVAAFIGGKIGFYDITDIIAGCMDRTDHVIGASLETILQTNESTRILAENLVAAKARRGKSTAVPEADKTRAAGDDRTRTPEADNIKNH